MGRLVIQELGFSVDVVKAMLLVWDVELESESVDVKRKRDLVVVGGALVILVGGSLPNQGFLHPGRNSVPCEAL